MCIVIDVNAFSRIFSSVNPEHHIFEPVKKWILSGPGKLVYGGDKYMMELGRTERYRRLVKLLNDVGKTINMNSEKENISKIEKELDKLKLKGFNDSHIVALLKVFGCRIICTYDSESHEFIKKPDFYNGKTPVIYWKSSLKSARTILSVNNIPAQYKPTEKLSKSKQKMLEENILKVI